MHWGQALPETLDNKKAKYLRTLTFPLPVIRAICICFSIASEHKPIILRDDYTQRFGGHQIRVPLRIKCTTALSLSSIHREVGLLGRDLLSNIFQKAKPPEGGLNVTPAEGDVKGGDLRTGKFKLRIRKVYKGREACPRVII